MDFFFLSTGFLDRIGREKLLRLGNTGREVQLFPLPFFVFNEKIRIKTVVTCKSMTMVSIIKGQCRKKQCGTINENSFFITVNELRDNISFVDVRFFFSCSILLLLFGHCHFYYHDSGMPCYGTCLSVASFFNIDSCLFFLWVSYFWVALTFVVFFDDRRHS